MTSLLRHGSAAPRLALRLGPLALAFACSSGDPAAPAGEDASPPPTEPRPSSDAAPPACEAVALADDACLPVSAPSCPAGTRAALGRLDCVGVGVPTCAPPLVRDPSGFGCEARLPSTCPEGQRPTTEGCAPIGRCDAAFPPPAATYFVSPTATVDATHKRTFAAALAAAPAGATIAVEAGTYAEAIAPSRAVTLVGRCAARVLVTAPTPGSGAAVRVASAVRVELRGMTLRGFGQGAFVEGGGTLVVRDAAVDGARGIGAYARAASRLELSGVLLRGTTPDAAGNNGWGAAAFGASALVLDDVTIDGAATYGLLASGAGSNLEARRVVVRGVRVPPSAARFEGAGLAVTAGAKGRVEGLIVDDADATALQASSGAVVEGSELALARPRSAQAVGLRAVGGAKVRLERATVLDAPLDGVLADGEGTQVALDASAVVGSGPLPAGRGVELGAGARFEGRGLALAGLGAGGLFAQRAARARLDGALVVDVDPRRVTGSDTLGFQDGVGVEANVDADVTLVDTTVERATTAGVLADKGTLALERALVRGTRVDPAAGYGYAIGAWALRGARVVATSSAVDAHVGAGVVVERDASDVSLAGVLVTRVGVTPDGMALGLLVHGGASVRASDVLVVDVAGPGLAASAGTLAFDRGALVRNGVAAHAEGGTRLVEAESGAAAEPLELRISRATRFVGNTTRLGAGTVPLPDPFRKE